MSRKYPSDPDEELTEPAEAAEPAEESADEEASAEAISPDPEVQADVTQIYLNEIGQRTAADAPTGSGPGAPHQAGGFRRAAEDDRA